MPGVVVAGRPSVSAVVVLCWVDSVVDESVGDGLGSVVDVSSADLVVVSPATVVEVVVSAAVVVEATLSAADVVEEVMFRPADLIAGVVS